MASGKYSTFSALDGAVTSHNGRRPAHPHAQASWLSRVFLTWVTPIMTLGNTKQLDADDIWPLQRHHQAGVVAATFARDYAHSQSIPRAFLASFGLRFVLTGVAFFVATASTLVGPLVLNHVVSALSSDVYDVQDLMTWIFGLLVTQLIQALADNYANFDSEVIAIQFTGALKNLIYNKTLKLSAEARKIKSTGDITNLYTTDCQFILMAAYFVHQLWLVPLQILCVSVLLYKLLGIAAFAGLAVIGLVFVVNHFISTTIYTMYIQFMERKDARLKAVTEAFKSITIIKFNAWEDKFLARIGEARRLELENIWLFMKYNATSVVLTWGLPVFISIAAFAVYSAVLGHTLTPAIVFTSIALFQLVQVPLRYITDIIAALIKAKVAEKRIAEFLQLPEIDPNNVLSIHHPEADEYIAKNVIVSIESGAFGWGKQDSNSTEGDQTASMTTTTTTQQLLTDVNLTAKVGDFVVIHGPVGCGKSSLCSALIGDMTKLSGRVYVGGSVAYCSQQPWIQHMTVRDNILFGRAYDRTKYEKVLEACALKQDLVSLPAGDQTEIGERGVNLSGGQKARVGLARACYSDASVYILDSPLAAVDAIVANEIFQKCLLGLLRNRTIVLVTHNPEVIASEYVTRAYTIDGDGKLVETRQQDQDPGRQQPVYKDSLVTPLAARPYVKPTYGFDEDDSVECADGDRSGEMQDAMVLSDLSAGIKSPLRPMVPSFADADDSAEKTPAEDATEKDQLIKEEERSQGRVGFHVFAAYYRAVGGFPILALILISQSIWQGLQIASDLWLSQWSTDSLVTTGDTMSQGKRMTIYTALGLISAMMVAVRVLTVSWCGLRAAARLFDQMTYSLMHAPMKFFDANPIGRILMRYSNDVTDVDIGVPLSFGGFFANLFSVGCSIATTAVIIRWKGIFLLPIVALYVLVGKFYLNPAREVERVTRTTEAPLLSHLSESIDGGSIIRAFGGEHLLRFKNTNDSKLDYGNKVWYARLCISRWFALRVQLLGTLLVFVVAYSLVLLHNQLSAAIVGLAFSYVLKVSQSMERIIQAWSSVETTMVSPERMQQYVDVEQEAPHKIPSMDPPAYPAWPSSGSIKFDNVCFRYKDDAGLVLKNLSFTVKGGEKIGIVGRTGAGKSSLTMALFRINELASGSISIDGVDVGRIGLKALRQELSIIPQNPVLFKGTLRAYLDPFGDYTDDQLWSSIRRVGLGDRISGEEDKLEYIVEENGENFSVGERQMLCMARALLHHSRIVIFDEATASIDRETDQKLQRVIREAFDKSTVLTIAHRLDTILDSDRILVLDAGEAVEYATPAALVKKGKGHFYDLMQEGGYLDKFLSNNKM